MFEFMSKNRRNAAKDAAKPSVSGATAGIISAILAKDAEIAPEDAAALVEELVDAVQETVMESVANQADDEIPAQFTENSEKKPVAEASSKEVPAKDDDEAVALLKALSEQINGIVTRLDALETAAKTGAKAADEDPLEKLEKELEEGAVIEAETEEVINKDEAEEEEVEEEETTIVTAAAKDAALRFIRDMKPVIAKMPKGAERKRAADSLAKAARSIAYGGGEGANGYGAINEKRREQAGKFARDKASGGEAKIGEDIRNAHNPHYNGKLS